MLALAVWLVTELPTRLITPLCVARVLLRLVRADPLSAWGYVDVYALVETAFCAAYVVQKRSSSALAAHIPEQEHLDRHAREPPIQALARVLDDLAVAIGPDGDRASEVTSWFLASGPAAAGGARVDAHTPDWSELRADNLREWLAWAFWNIAHYRDIPHDELQPLVLAVQRWVRADRPQLAELADGRNAAITACRLTLDELRCKHRPLFAYLVTHFACVSLAACALRARGFAPRRAGAIAFWHRPPASSAAAGGAGPPLVFLCGMGVGAVSYLRFIDCLTAAFPARALLLIEMDYICMRLPLRAHVPSPEATVAGLRGVLAAVGAESAHWMGHSFGTIVLSWLLRLAPPRCLAACTFVDPIPFLLFKSNVAVHFVYRPPSSAVDRLVRYFVAEELGISTMLHRHFSWTHNLLDPRLLDGVPTAVVLSERDAYVPSAAIARHLAHRAPEVLVVTLEGYLHSEFCFSAQGPARVAAAVVDADGRRRPPTAADGRQRVKSPAAARRSSGRRATSPAGGAK